MIVLNAQKREFCYRTPKKSPEALASGLGEESWGLSLEIIVEGARRFQLVGIATGPLRDWIAALVRTGRRWKISWGNKLR